MINIRQSAKRGHFDYGWLNTHHTFSFARYYDENFMGFRTMRVLNEDFIQPGSEFGTHPHRDMEIVTYVISGELSHKDNMGNGSKILPGDVQRMTAGTGVTHSESNHSQSEVTHLFQIWFLPERNGLTPGYEQKMFPAEEKVDNLKLLVSPDGRDGSISLNQDVLMYASILDQGKQVRHALADGRHAWIQVASGAIEVNGQALDTGDGAAISDEGEVTVVAIEKSEFLLIEMA